MSRARLFRPMVILAALLGTVPLAPAQQQFPSQVKEKGELPPPVPGEFRIRGEGKEIAPTLLGARVGEETVDGVKVGLYYLQAASPEKLKPTSPTHLFYVVLRAADDKEGAIIDDATGSVLFEGNGLAREVPLNLAESDLPPPRYEVPVRMEKAGMYDATVRFTTGNGKGEAKFQVANTLQLPGKK